MTEPSRGAADPGQGTLAERANLALLALANRADQERTENELATITSACNRAEEVTARLVSCTSVGAELASRGVQYRRPSVIMSAVRAIPNLRRTATQAADPGQDLTGRLRSGAIQEGLKAAETTAKNLEQALIRAAETERARLKPHDLDRPVATMPGQESLQARIVKIKLSLTRSFNGPVEEVPTAVDQWRQHAAEWEEVREQTNQRMAELSPEIKAFVEAAASDNGAPWSMISPAVRDWLDSDGHGDGYGVRKW